MPIKDAYGGVRVEAYSPDDSISARLTMSEGLSLEYHPAGLDHTDDGLERQLQHVLQALVVNTTNAMSVAAGHANGERQPLGDDLDSRVAAARGERAVELLSDFEAVEVAADGSLRIRLSADGTIGVDVAYGAVDAHGGDRLVEEARGAVRRLFAAQAARFDEVHDTVVNKLERSELEEPAHGRNRY